MGRYKLPDKVKEVRGTKRKSREQGEEVLSATTITSLQDVNIPTHLNADAKKIYREVVSQLFAMKILQPIDDTALCIFANAVATIHKMQKALDKEGYLIYVEDKNGNTLSTINPMQKVLKDAINTAATIGAQFGWSPAARIRLVATLDKKEPENDFSKFLEQ